MQAQIATVAAGIARHPKTLHAKNASYQQVQQVLHSHLYQQTGHYATANEMGVLMLIVLALIVLGLLKKALG